MKQADQYFARRPQSASAPAAFSLTWQERAFVFETDSGVFSRGGLDFGTQVLLKALPPCMAGRVLDLGCGWGAVGTILGALHPTCEITMADVNERAVTLARKNAAANGVPATVVQSDGFEHITGSFDLIALNPPIRAGKAVVYSLFEGCRAHLSDSGRLYVVMRKQQGADSAQKFLGTLFPHVDTVARRDGYHVLACSTITPLP